MIWAEFLKVFSFTKKILEEALSWTSLELICLVWMADWSWTSEYL